MSNLELLSDLADWRALLQDHQEDEASLAEMIKSNLDVFLLTSASLVEIGMQHPLPHLAGSAPSAFRATRLQLAPLVRGQAAQQNRETLERAEELVATYDVWYHKMYHKEVSWLA